MPMDTATDITANRVRHRIHIREAMENRPTSTLKSIVPGIRPLFENLMILNRSRLAGRDSTMSNLSPIAIAAARAARNPQWGRFACLRYCQRLGVPASIYTLARVLAAAERAGL